MDSGQRQGSAVARMIWVAGSPILFTIGVVGNIMTIIVLTGKHNKMTSTSLFLIVLAIADLGVMTLVQPRWWLIYTFGIDVRYLSNMACKTQWFITYMCGTYSTSTLGIVTIERVISTVKPYKVKTWCSVKIAAFIALMLFCVLAALYGHIFYGFKLLEIKTIVKTSAENSTLCKHHSTASSTDMEDLNHTITNGSQYPANISNCFDGRNTTMTDNEPVSAKNTDVFNGSLTTVSPVTGTISETKDADNMMDDESVTITRSCWFDDYDYGKFYTGPVQLITLSIANIVPETIFLIGGGIIIWKLFKSARWRKRVTHGTWRDIDYNGRTRRSDIQAIQITRTLLLVNFTFFVCTTPVLIFLVGRPFWVDQEKGMTETQEIVWAVVNQMYYLNYATNFILYFLSGARFRKLVVKTFCRKNKTTQQSGHISYISSYNAATQGFSSVS